MGGKLTFRPDIEGLRGMAVLLVVLYHAGVSFLSGGFVGVDVFFVLSGYLITRLLVDELRETGRVDLLAFYARRARRLLPAAALVIATTLCLGAVIYGPSMQRQLAVTAATASAYVSNFRFAAQTVDYFAAPVETSPLLHMWSLSIEEQFYLAWPVILMLAAGAFSGRRRGRGALLLATGSVAVLSFMAAAWLVRLSPASAFFMPHARGWEFAVGALAGLTPLTASKRSGRQAAVAGTGWLGLGLIVAAAVTFDSSVAFPGAPALLPVLGVALLLTCSGEPESGLHNLLALPPLTFLGRLSYGWYLWHWPALVVAKGLWPSLSVTAGITVSVVALVLAWLSYRFVENRVRHAPPLVASPRRSLAMGTSLMIVVFAAAYGLHETGRAVKTEVDTRLETLGIPSAFSPDCDPWAFDGRTASLCEYGGGGKTVVLFGDSHAEHWLAALQVIADEREWRLVQATRGGCPAEMYARSDSGMAINDACEAWRASALEQIADLKADVVLVSSRVLYPGVRDAVWLEGLRVTLDGLAPYAGQVVLMRDVPEPGFNVRTCVESNLWRSRLLASRGPDCDFPREDAVAAVRFELASQAAKDHPNVLLADVSDLVCPGTVCRSVVDGLVTYVDEGHISVPYSASLAGALDVILDAALYGVAAHRAP